MYREEHDRLQESPVFPLVCCNLWVLEICQFMTPEDLVQLGLVNKYFHLNFLGEKSTAIWKERCAELWKGKIYIPVEFRCDPSVSSYFLSIKDANRSCFKSREELCSIDFHFKFKHDAGEYWTSHDPSYHGGEPKCAIKTSNPSMSHSYPIFLRRCSYVQTVSDERNAESVAGC